MSNFRLKLKRLLETSFNENKKIDSVYHKKIIQNNKTLDSKFIFNNVSKLLLPERNKSKNISCINNINNYNTKENEKICLYKKYKKYNSIFDKPRIKVSKNILNSNKIQETEKTRHIFDYSLSSQMLIKNKRQSNSISSNHLTLDNFFNKKQENKVAKNNKKMPINYRNRNYIEYQMEKIKKKKNSSNRVGNKIIQKIELIENENKEKKIKNLLINRSPIVFNNNMYKSSNHSYTYYFSKSRNDSKNKQTIINKSKNFLDLDDLKDIISSIKNQKYTIIRNKEFNNLNK